ncbi:MULTISPECIES: FAD-binding oxidoreductase [Aerococcus]|uniref:FAD-binding oxidoreductase n=1 Tax=Aerococcus loyolae TaxID=2976809 RepID=A0ABT4C0G4_9LACT|nr:MULTISPECIES: FAD-binding oxidoreductase [Aerococcus]KAA9220683.1 FAD-binding oxidoreductase [Aerococcus loyolae]KAA9265404.1 FAD-binding oxidoreductase [Aerococcus loyolae]MCY3025058.1 FAD-binding oxidoreductase [Aerococcus loyolae]MCY3026885.1 FAD-binding oxidoreductase [Aerococcus loyolae]MCY3028470.1 FAD-binding oxidoreductase [Aerococcus loyolae]
MTIERQVDDKYLTTFIHESEAGHAEGIIYPENEEEIVEAVKKAQAEGKKLVTIGGHTALAGGTYPQGEILLNLEKMNQILDLDKETLTLTVEAGVTLNQVRDYLEGSGYFYAPDPGEKRATVAGNAATNAGGMRAIKYGVTRDNIRSMRVVLANGEVINAGSLNNKDSSGYDLKDLFIGSEGTLGIISQLQLKLRVEPKYENSLLIGFDRLEELGPVIYEILHSSVAPTALEMFEHDAITYAEELLGKEMPSKTGQAFLLVTLSGNQEAAIQKDLENLEKIAQNAGALATELLSGEVEKGVWDIRDHILSGIYKAGPMRLDDPVVPVNKITQAINKSKEIADDLGIASTFFGHAGDGNIHICLMKKELNDQEWEDRLHQYDLRLYDFLAENGGLPSGEHGIGLERVKFMPIFFSETELNTMKAIKKALDPNNLLNPGRVIEVDE